MKILLLSIGSRGDVEPFLAIAEQFAARGHEIVCAFPEQFREVVEPLKYKFYGFDKAFLEMIEGEGGRALMGSKGNWLQRISNLIKMGREGIRLQKVMVKTQIAALEKEQADRVFYHPKVTMPVLWGMAERCRCTLICPLPCIIHPTREQSTIGVWGNKDYGTRINLWSYWLVNTIRSRVTVKFTKPFHSQFPNLKINSRRIYDYTLEEAETYYTISPTLYARPDYWPTPVQVVGYHERNKALHWQPDAALTEFLNRYEKIVFITFGSMVNDAPERKTAAIIEVLKKHNIPAIVNTSWGGLQKVENVPEHIHFVSNIPYDWIFPKMYAVVHHGGSGTTHTTLKNGCASLIIPHIVDQFFWNRHISGMGAGPKGIAIKKLTAARFEPLLLDLYQNESYKKRAKEIAQQMKAEQLPLLPDLP